MKDLTKGTPARIMISFAVPVALGNMFQLCYSLADTRVVGSALGETALAAVGATASISTLFYRLSVRPYKRLFSADRQRIRRRKRRRSKTLCRRQPAPWSFNCPGPHTGLSRRPPMDPRTFKRAPGASYPIRQLYPRHSVRTVCHHAVQCLRLCPAGCRRYNSPSAVSDFCSCIKCGFRSGFYHVLWLGHRRSRLCYGSVPGGGGLLKPDLYVLQIPDLPLLPG